jgi:hypothetical protein
MPSSEVEIANLVYRCGECIDSGDLAGELALFAHATIETGTSEVVHRDVLPIWRTRGPGRKLVNRLIARPAKGIVQNSGKGLEQYALAKSRNHGFIV